MSKWWSSATIYPLDLKEEPMNPKLFDYDAVNGDFLGNLLAEKLYGDMDSFCQSIVQRFEKKTPWNWNLKYTLQLYSNFWSTIYLNFWVGQGC